MAETQTTTPQEAAPRTHLDATVEDIVEHDGAFFFAPKELGWQENNLVRSRLNREGEGHPSREAALAHLETLKELGPALRSRYRV